MLQKSKYTKRELFKYTYTLPLLAFLVILITSCKQETDEELPVATTKSLKETIFEQVKNEIENGGNEFELMAKFSKTHDTDALLSEEEFYTLEAIFTIMANHIESEEAANEMRLRIANNSYEDYLARKKEEGYLN